MTVCPDWSVGIWWQVSVLHVVTDTSTMHVMVPTFHDTTLSRPTCFFNRDHRSWCGSPRTFVSPLGRVWTASPPGDALAFIVVELKDIILLWLTFLRSDALPDNNPPPFSYWAWDQSMVELTRQQCMAWYCDMHSWLMACCRFEPKRAVQQLRACGVLETIRISAAGYPSR